MTSPRNQHCANCIGTLSFPVDSGEVSTGEKARGGVVKRVSSL